MEKLYAGKTIEDVIQVYSDTLLRVAFHNLKSIADSEDIVQEVFIKLINSKKAYISDEHLKAWLIRVTINLTKDFFRSSWHRKVVPINEDMDFLAPEEKDVMEEIFQLKKDERNIIYLYYYEGYKIEEIAEIMRKSTNTISSKMQRARKKLKTIIIEWRKDDE